MKTVTEIEAMAEKVLISNAVQSVPVPIHEIAIKEDILVSEANSKSVSGVLLRKSGIAFIALNSSESPVRKRFTLAHELGHYFLHLNKNTFVEFRDNKKNIIRGPKEVEANKFAAALLMPKKFLEKDIATFANAGVSEEHIKFLAKRYEVSEEAMGYRLMNLSF